MGRGKAEETLTIGVAGRGKTSRKNAAALFEDLLDGHKGDVKVILAVADEDWNEAYDGIFDVIEERKLEYDAVYDQAAKKDKDLGDIIDDASSKSQVQQVARKVVAELDKANEPRELIVLWDAKAVDELSDDEIGEEPGYAAVEAADEAGIKALDLTMALESITLTDDGDDGDDSKDSKDDDKGDDAQEDEDTLPTRKELEEMERDQLKELAEKEGLDLPKRAHTPTIIDALDKHFEKLAGEADGDAKDDVSDDGDDRGGDDDGEPEGWEKITEEIVTDVIEEAVKAIGAVMREAVDEIVRESRKDAVELGKRIKEGFDDLLDKVGTSGSSTSGDKSGDDDEDRPRSRRSRGDDEDERPRRRSSRDSSDDGDEPPRRRRATRRG